LLKANNVRINVIKEQKFVRDEGERKLVLNDFHMLPTGGHAGATRMAKTVKKYYVWPCMDMDKDIEKFVTKCESCQRFKHSLPAREPMVVTTTSTEAMSKIFMDIVGSIVTDAGGYSYILTMQCELAKYVVAVPLANKDAQTVAFVRPAWDP
jgi:Integrase zinc binding domain